jgi:ABC-2 type transport system permease protein
VNGSVSRALRAEWTKLRSLRSTMWTTILIVGVTVGVSAFLAAVGGTNANEAGFRGDDDVVVNGLRGVWLGQVAIVALGAVAVTSEFATGTIRATFGAIPRRLVAFGAKVSVVAGIAFTVGLVTSVLSFVVAQPLLHEGGYVPPAYPIVSLSDAFAFRAVVGTALYLTLLALLAAGVAAIVRHTAAAMTIAVGLVLVPTVIMEFFTGTPRESLQQVAPSAGLAIQITTSRYDTPPLGPWGGLGVTAVWTVVALVVAAWTIRRRDV